MSCDVKNVKTTSKNELVRKIALSIKESKCNYSKAFDILAVALDEGHDIGITTIYCDFICDVLGKREIKYDLTNKDLIGWFDFKGYSDQEYISAKSWFEQIKQV